MNQHYKSKGWVLFLSLVQYLLILGSGWVYHRYAQEKNVPALCILGPPMVYLLVGLFSQWVKNDFHVILPDSHRNPPRARCVRRQGGKRRVAGQGRGGAERDGGAALGMRSEANRAGLVGMLGSAKHVAMARHSGSDFSPPAVLACPVLFRPPWLVLLVLPVSAAGTRCCAAGFPVTTTSW